MALARAQRAPRGRYRLCLHASTEDRVQEMVVATTAASYGRPHCHPDGPASLYVIEGELAFFVFDAAGRVQRKVELGARGGGRPFCVRVAPGVWHMDLVRSGAAVFLETMAGPFVKDRSNLYAPWAPAEGDAAAVRAFLQSLGEPGPGPEGRAP